MKAEVKLLMQVQELDLELKNLQESLKRFAPELERIDRDRQRRNKDGADAQAKQAALAQERRKLELELKTSEERQAKFRKQQEQVRTAKEAEALGHEVQATDAEISRIEERILQLLDEEDALVRSQAIGKIKSQRDEVSATEEESRLTTLKREKEEMIKALKEDRIAGLNKLEEDVRETYTWIYKKHGPPIVVALQGEACGGCGAMLVPHVALKIKMDTELSSCPQCHRFLVSQEVLSE